MIYAGSQEVTAAYLGGVALSEIYLGGSLVWSGRLKPGAASMRLWLAQAAGGAAAALVAAEVSEAIPLRHGARGEAAALVEVSAAHSIPLAQSAGAEALGLAEGAPLWQLLALVMERTEGVALVLHPLTVAQSLSLTMHIPDVVGLALNPLRLEQALAVTMPIPGAQGVALNPITMQQAVTAQLPAGEGADITVIPGQAAQAEPLTMRAAGEAAQVAPGAADHVLPPMVGDIAPEVLTAEDAAAPESIALAVSAEAQTIYPRFVQRGDTVYIYRPKRWRQEGGTVYLDYEETSWEAPEEDGDALIIRQVYSATENGDYLEVT